MLKIIFLHCLFLSSVSSQVLKFSPIAGDKNNPNFTLTISSNQNSTASFSICLRFKFKVLSSQCIFEAQDSIKLTFNDYLHSGGGNLHFASFVSKFHNDFDLQKLLNWQDVCIVYDRAKTKLKLFLNSELKLNVSSENKFFQLGSNIWMGNCLNLPFNGEMTDLNIWSR